MKILMVCLGNICRSPLAEGILKNKIKNKNIIIDSAGTAGYHVGNSPDIRSIEIGEKYNIDISNQRARQFINSDFDDFDVIYVMDISNYTHLINIAKNTTQKNKIKLILDEIEPDSFKSVPDPYYGEENGFEIVYKMLNEACEKIKQNLE